jgi:hypothetical protein
MAKLIEREQVTKYSVIRGPTTRQFWTVAKHVPGIAHLLGFCHGCDACVDPRAHGCPECGVPFGAYLDRNYLGLPEVCPLPGETPLAPPDERAAATMRNEAWTPPSMTPRGLSSFAGDDELLAAGAAAPAMSVAPFHANGPGRMADAPSAPDVRADTTLVRTMQRQVARQQRTIRVLTVLVIAVAIAGAAFNLVAFSGLRSGGPSREPDAGPVESAHVVEPVERGDAGRPAAADVGTGTEPADPAGS